MKNFRMFALAFLLIALADLSHASAAELSRPMVGSKQILTFTQWKEHEVSSANERIARLNNEISQLRRENGDHFQGIKPLARQLQSAVAAASVVQKLTADDYINVYLSHLKPAPAMLQKIAKSLTKNEIADLLKSYFKSRNNAAGGMTSVRIAAY